MSALELSTIILGYTVVFYVIGTCVRLNKYLNKKNKEEHANDNGKSNS